MNNNDNNRNKGQNNNFNQNMNQINNNNFNNNQEMNQQNNNGNPMMNPNMQNNNVDVQVLNLGFLQGNNYPNININEIQNICASNINGNNPSKSISDNLQKQYRGEWVVAVVNKNDNFEFNISEITFDKVIVLQVGQKNIHIYKYV